MNYGLTEQYTLWSRGRMIGVTDLGFMYHEDGLRCGWLRPNELGERLLPAATGVAPAMRAEFMIGPDSTLHADILAALDAEHALELELRGPSGDRIPTEDIGIRDTHYLLSIPQNDRPDEELGELTPEQQAEIDEWVAEIKAEHPEWLSEPETEAEVEFPRYQIQVRLVDHDAIP
jgi:hypothetical protein